jgi:hypothetical protein
VLYSKLFQICFGRIARLFRMAKDDMLFIVLLDVGFKASAVIAVIG